MTGGESTAAAISFCSWSTGVCASFSELYDGRTIASIKKDVSLSARVVVVACPWMCSASVATVFATVLCKAPASNLLAGALLGSA
ncbi:hypothetical protein PR001_g14976 [Phytophthora rubi]|uniref:Uncharacterized protein n=1 Tax=Phytophthora rubi TaxID=129364 RepID=A0A6A3LH28_9STRA|nr:hypothetical protein PR002_g15681 [Phytophthora rubi]KAE9015123.1 hypothetical protein PR001_g14976 [Phytophthora rubi]